MNTTEHFADKQETISSSEQTQIFGIPLIRLHRFAGLTLAGFIALHLCNHLVALISIEAHIRVMQALRLVYRNPLVETALMLAILIQVPSGITLVRRKVGKKAEGKGWRGVKSRAEKVQIVSGLYMSFFLVAHVFAVMAGRYFFTLDTNFYFASAPLLSIFWLYYVVYYGLSVVAVFLHIASIHYQKVQERITPRRAQIQALTIATLGFIFAVLILAAFSGVVHEIALPKEYKWW